jgi:hypothetical protein
MSRPVKPIVYFIQRGANGPIKIGTTSGRLRTRLKEIQTGSPEPLYLIGHVRGLEKDVHVRFRRHLISGEWFEPHEDIVDFVRLNKLPPPSDEDSVLPIALRDLSGSLRKALDRERRRMSKAAGAEVKTSAVIRAILEERLRSKRRPTANERAA